MFRFLFVLSLLAINLFAEEDTIRDSSLVSFFVQPGISFLGFDDRDKFDEAIDSIYVDLRNEAKTSEESLAVSKQNFQKVNVAFPITAGVQVQVLDDHFLSAGIGFVYDKESVVLTDRNEKTHNYYYTLQAVSLFLEYRFAIPNSFLTLSGESLFSVAVRYYWMLPGTEIYSSWGCIKAKRELLGNGFGFSIGYLIATWKNFKIYGDLGFTSISLESDESFDDIVPLYEKSDELQESKKNQKAKWDLGGLQLQIRISFGAVYRKPKNKMSDTENTTEKRIEIPDSLTTPETPTGTLQAIPE